MADHELKRVTRLAADNPKAVNEMTATIVAGMFAGNEDLKIEYAVDQALESLERILRTTKQYDDVEGQDEG